MKKLNFKMVDLNALDCSIENDSYFCEKLYTKPDTPYTKQNLQDYFEELYSNQLSMELESSSDLTSKIRNYADTRTNSAYRAFLLAVTEMRTALHRSIRKIKKTQVAPPFIIGMEVTDNTVQFGFRPYRYSTIERATAEAERLIVSNPQKRYSIFAKVHEMGIMSLEVNETTQGVKGKLVRSPFKVMEDLKNLTSEQKDKNMPNGVKIEADGSFSVTHSLDETINKNFESFQEAVDYLNNWLRLQ